MKPFALTGNDQNRKPKFTSGVVESCVTRSRCRGNRGQRGRMSLQHEGSRGICTWAMKQVAETGRSAQ
ncbi:hypothetical protein NQZ68_029001 [Dissostichus eleginoides]|nr:hypothetical protein NQZ68_029001 [Dissostichus eleginoides]